MFGYVTKYDYETNPTEFRFVTRFVEPVCVRIGNDWRKTILHYWYNTIELFLFPQYEFIYACPGTFAVQKVYHHGTVRHFAGLLKSEQVNVANRAFLQEWLAISLAEKEEMCMVAVAPDRRNGKGD